MSAVVTHNRMAVYGFTLEELHADAANAMKRGRMLSVRDNIGNGKIRFWQCGIVECFDTTGG